jgi:hypothetical protein
MMTEVTKRRLRFAIALFKAMDNNKTFTVFDARDIMKYNLDWLGISDWSNIIEVGRWYNLFECIGVDDKIHYKLYRKIIN